MGTKWTPERTEHVSLTTSRNKPIVQYTTDDIFIADYISCSEAARKLNYNMKSLNACVNGQLKTYKGFKWRLKP